MSQSGSVCWCARTAWAMKTVFAPIAALLFAWSPDSFAGEDQPEDSRPAGFPQYLMLLSSPPVQQDIRLSDEQKAEIARLAKIYMQSVYEFHGHMREMTDLPGLSPQDRIEVTADMRKKNAELAAQMDKNALEILKPSQHKRLAQLRLQVMGAAILLDPRVRERLKVSDKQQKRLKESFEQRNQACNEYLAEAKKKGARPHELKAKIDEIRSEAWLDMQRIFTSTQRRTLRDLLGPEPEFEVSEIQLQLSLKIR